MAQPSKSAEIPVTGGVTRAHMLEGDKRWRTTLRGLVQLSDDELRRLSLAARDPDSSGLQLDTGNFDPQTGSWCALAVGLDVPRLLSDHGLQVRTRSAGRAALMEVGTYLHGDNFTDSPLSGVPGEALTSNRQADLFLAVHGVLAYRNRGDLGIDVASDPGLITEALYYQTAASTEA